MATLKLSKSSPRVKVLGQKRQDRIIDERKSVKIDQIKKDIAYLKRTYPKAFTPHKVLAIGIHEQIRESDTSGISNIRISRALRYYTYSDRYLNAMLKRNYRVNLDGSKAQQVLKAHRGSASKILARGRGHE